MAIVDWPSNVGGQIMTKPAGATNVPGQSRLVEYIDRVTGLPTGEMRVERYLYNNVGIACVAGDVYMLTFSTVLGQSPQVVIPAATTPLRNLVVAVEAVAIGAYGWFATAGPVECTLEGTADIAPTNFLKYTTATSLTGGGTISGFMLDGAAETAASHAIYCTPASGASVTAAGNTRPTASVPQKVILLGHRATVA